MKPLDAMERLDVEAGEGGTRGLAAWRVRRCASARALRLGVRELALDQRRVAPRVPGLHQDGEQQPLEFGPEPRDDRFGVRDEPASVIRPNCTLPL